MFDFGTMPLTPENARAARNYLGLSQAKAAEESDLPAHKIKRFEAGNYIPDVEFLQDLRAFFEARGYRFPGTPQPGAKAKGSGQVFPAGVLGETAENHGVPAVHRPQQASVHHMRIALTDEDEMGNILDLIDANEQRIEELLQAPVEFGLFGGLSEESQAHHAEALKLMAENGQLFARLFGRAVGGPADSAVLDGQARPETHAQLMHKSQAEAHLIVAGNRDAKVRRQAHKPARTLLGALFA